MKIEIREKNIIDDARGVFLRETPDGTLLPPQGTLHQYSKEANARIVIMLSRYLVFACQHEANDDLYHQEELSKWEYTLAMSSRRGAGKIEPLTHTIHSFFVNYMLSKLFANSGLTDLATKHDTQSTSDAQAILKLINVKRPPLC